MRRDVGDQHRRIVGRGLEQGQGQALERRRLHEHTRVLVQRCGSSPYANPVKTTWVRREIAQAAGVLIGEGGVADDRKLLVTRHRRKASMSRSTRFSGTSLPTKSA